jgi:hypothetical protein
MFGTITIADLTIHFGMIAANNVVDMTDPLPDDAKFNVTTMDCIDGETRTAVVDGNKFTKALALALLFDGRIPDTADEVLAFWKDAEEAVKDLHRIMP